jgi:hypothetical protein
VIESAFEIPKNVFDMSKVRRTRIMHTETGLLDRVGNIWTSKSGMLKRTSKTAIKGRIKNGITISREFGAKFSRCAIGLTVTHASTRKYVQEILALRERKRVDEVRETLMPRK